MDEENIISVTKFITYVYIFIFTYDELNLTQLIELELLNRNVHRKLLSCESILVAIDSNSLVKNGALRGERSLTK